MIASREIQPIASDLSERVLTFNLTLRSADAVSVRSCEVLGRNFRNRISFTDAKFLEDVLVPRLADAVRSCLGRLPKGADGGAQVLAMPEFIVELPGLALSGVHIMVMQATDGVRNAILRFKEFMGAVNSAFREDIGYQEPLASHSEKLAVNVLAEVCLPILNLVRAFEHLDACADDKRAIAFADRAREFEFQTELLKRFIFNSSMGHAEATGAYLAGSSTDYVPVHMLPTDHHHR